MMQAPSSRPNDTGVKPPPGREPTAALQSPRTTCGRFSPKSGGRLGPCNPPADHAVQDARRIPPRLPRPALSSCPRVAGGQVAFEPTSYFMDSIVKTNARMGREEESYDG